MHFSDFVGLYEHELLFVDDVLLDFFEEQVGSLLFVSFDRLESIEERLHTSRFVNWHSQILAFLQ
jgi:hypothetical protein